MRWRWKWRKELESGFYYNLLTRGFIKQEEQEPDITGFEFYFDAFSELSTTRGIGLALGPIPFTAITEYSRLYEIEDFEEFSYVVRRMDNIFLELNAPTTKGDKSGSTDSNKKNLNQGRHR